MGAFGKIRRRMASEETEAALGTMWEGEAKKGFHTVFSNDVVQLRNFYNAIIAYISAEQANAEVAQSLSSDVIV